MRIVASAAGGISGVLARDDLREGFRFGGVRLMACHAEFCCVGKNGFLRVEVLAVQAEWSVAGFASDIDVRPFAFCRGDVVMASGAGLAAAKNWIRAAISSSEAGRKCPYFPNPLGTTAR